MALTDLVMSLPAEADLIVIRRRAGESKPLVRARTRGGLFNSPDHDEACISLLLDALEVLEERIADYWANRESHDSGSAS